MPQIHPTAVIDGDVTLADDVVVGPYCILDGVTGSIRIGQGTRLFANVHLTGPLQLGERNVVYGFACLGYAAQDLKWDPARPGAGVVIGNDNTFREYATVHRATSDEQPTLIGSNNYFMAMTHAGHDVRVDSYCTLANAAMLGGFVQVADRVIIGGLTGVHQFSRIGRGCMLGACMSLMQDLPPYFMLTGPNVSGGINLVGLRRAGVPSSAISDIRWVFSSLYRRGLSMSSALDVLRTRTESETVREYITFIEQSKRGICQGHGRRARSAVASVIEPVVYRPVEIPAA